MAAVDGSPGPQFAKDTVDGALAATAKVRQIAARRPSRAGMAVTVCEQTGKNCSVSRRPFRAALARDTHDGLDFDGP